MDALIKHLKSSKDSKPDNGKLPLLDDPSEAYLKEAIFFQLTTKRILTAESAPTLKPLTIPLPHSPFPASATVLVVTQDPHDKYAEKCRSNPRVQNVLGMGAIRKNYNSYEQLRRLRDGDIIGEEPALVLADEKIVVSLPRVLGKAFYRTPKTTPIPVRMTPSTIEGVVEEAFKRTYVRKNCGNCVAVRIGYAGMPVDDLIENCVAMWERCVSQKRLVKGGVDEVRGGYVKSGSSVALPVWIAQGLYTDEDILEGPIVKKVKSKAERKLIKPSVSKETENLQPSGIKRVGEDDIEKSFEERRARKMARQRQGADSRKESVKA